MEVGGPRQQTQVRVGRGGRRRFGWAEAADAGPGGPRRQTQRSCHSRDCSTATEGGGGGGVGESCPPVLQPAQPACLEPPPRRGQSAHVHDWWQ